MADDEVHPAVAAATVMSGAGIVFAHLVELETDPDRLARMQDIAERVGGVLDAFLAEVCGGDVRWRFTLTDVELIPED